MPEPSVGRMPPTTRVPRSGGSDHIEDSELLGTAKAGQAVKEKAEDDEEKVVEEEEAITGTFDDSLDKDPSPYMRRKLAGQARRSGSEDHT